jgi:hypothetical protein
MRTDPDNCGSCGNQCDTGAACKNGNCTCGATSCGDGTCTNLKNTPADCGTCGNSCDTDQTCVAGGCVCRAGLTACGGACVDYQHDVNNCGGCGTQCTAGNNPRCVDGMCRDTTCASIGRVDCNDGCYTTAQNNRDPLACGVNCDTCDTNQICAGGSCQDYFPPPSCTSCPCPACGTSATCCPVGAGAICVTGTVCP